MSHKLLALGIIILFICSSVPIVSADDTTPPVTTHTIDGVMGKNNFYISDVIVTLNATDDLSGVNVTHYFTWGPLYVYSEPLIFTGEGGFLVGYRSIDNAGNVEATKLTPTFAIDKYPPSIWLYGGKKDQNYTVLAQTQDSCSGVWKVSFYIDDELFINDTMPPFEITYQYTAYAHYVEAIAFDGAGHIASDGISLSIPKSNNNRMKHPIIYLSMYLAGIYGVWGGFLLAISSTIFATEPLEIYFPKLYSRGANIVESVVDWQDYWIEYAYENGWNWPVAP